MSRVEAQVFTDKLAALRYSRSHDAQFFAATTPGRRAVEALEFVRKTVSESETVGSVEKFGSRADALAASAPEIIARCTQELSHAKNEIYVVAVSLHQAQLALVNYLMGPFKWTKKEQDAEYIKALEAEAAKKLDADQV